MKNEFQMLSIYTFKLISIVKQIFNMKYRLSILALDGQKIRSQNTEQHIDGLVQEKT